MDTMDLFSQLDELHAEAKAKGKFKASKSLRSAASKKNRQLPWGATDGELAWRGVEETTAKTNKTIKRVRATTSEGRQRLKYHMKKQNIMNNRIKRERVASRKNAKLRRKKLQQAAQDALFENSAVRPSANERAGLEGKELKNWHMYMGVHCKIIKDAKPATKTRLAKHVRRQRKEIKQKKAAVQKSTSVNDGGLGGPKLLWWKKQRALHDRVVGGARARVSMTLPKHVREEIRTNEKKLEKKYKNWKLEDGGLEGSAKIHWDHMRELHDRVVGSAKASVDQKLPKHVQGYRDYLAKERKRPKTASLHEKMLKEMHEKVIAGATVLVDSKLDKYTKGLRAIRRKKSKAKFKNFDPNDGGLTGKERMHWKLLKKQQYKLVANVSPKIENRLPKHVVKRGKELQRKLKAKWSNTTLDDGGLHGKEKAHWHVMRSLHDRVVGSAVASVSIKHEKHVEAYRDHMKKKSREKWKHVDNAGLSGKELKHWKIMLESHNKVVEGAKVLVEAKLDPHLRRMRNLAKTKLNKKIKGRQPNDGGLEGKKLEHWKIMRGLHDEIVGTAKSAVQTQHEPHVLRYSEHVQGKSKQKYDKMTDDDGLLTGPELDWWVKQRRVHDAIVGKAKTSVDCWQGGKPKTENELLAFPRRVLSNEEKWKLQRKQERVDEEVRENNLKKALLVVDEMKREHGNLLSEEIETELERQKDVLMSDAIAKDGLP